jgi:putative transposase
MPIRKFPLIKGQVYHVFNKGIANIPTFINKREYQRAISAINYYRFLSPPIKLSRYLTLSKSDQMETAKKLQNCLKLVDIYAYCLMPNHFHFLLRQCCDKGISIFISNFINSYTKYFNTRHERMGPLFLGQFKAILVANDSQFLHLSRYVHLNPYTSYLVDNDDKLINYEWSLLKNYLNPKDNSFCSKELLSGFYKHNKNKYEEFVLNHKDYQRKLGEIKHLLLE